MSTIIGQIVHANVVFAERSKRMLPVVKEGTSCSRCTESDPGCCYQKVVVPVHEALVIADHLVFNKLDTGGLREKLSKQGMAMSTSTRKEWFRSKTPCAFLVDGKCSIYKIRPFACNAYAVVSDPKRCHPDSENNVVAIVNAQAAQAAHLVYSKRIHVETLGLKETEMRVLIGALPRLVGMMLDAMHLGVHGFRDYVRGQKWHSYNSINDDWVIQP